MSDARGSHGSSLAPTARWCCYLTPVKFPDRLAALIPPPRKYRHRYHDVLAPHSPLRPAVTAYAGLPLDGPAPPATCLPGHGQMPPAQTPTEPKRALPAATLWPIPPIVKSGIIPSRLLKKAGFGQTAESLGS